jgi:hypothetical protein
VLPSNLPPAPSLARLLAELPTPAVRVVCTGGVTLRRGPGGAWGVATAGQPAPDAAPLLTSALRALGLRTTPPNAAPSVRPPGAQPPGASLSGAAWGLPPESDPSVGGARPSERSAPRDPAGDWQAVDPDALARAEGVRAVVLLTDDDPFGDGGHLVSAAGTLGWRPPVQQLGDLPSLGTHALRLRFAVDAAEQRAIAAAMRYARAADAARQTAALLDVPDLTTLAVAPGLFVELDALFGAATETLEAVARLVEDAFGGTRPRRGADGTARDRLPQGRRAAFEARLRRARGAPPEVRDLLLAVWDAHGALAAGHRRAVRRAAAAELGPPTVRVHRLIEGAWTVALPIGAEADGPDGWDVGRRAGQDAFALGWTFATETWRAATLAIYAVTSER